MNQSLSSSNLQPVSGLINPRRVRISASISIALCVLLLALQGYALVSTYQPVIWVAVAITVVASGMNLAAVRLARPERALASMFMVLSSLLLAGVSLHLAFDRVSVIFLLAGFMLILTLALFTLPDRYLVYAISIALGVVVIGSLINFFQPFGRAQSPFMYNVTQAGALVILTLILLSLVWMTREMQLTGKLLVGFIFFSLIISVFLGGINGRRTSEILTNSIGDSLQAIAANRAQAVADLLSAQVDALKTFYISESIQKALIASNSAYDADKLGVAYQIQQTDILWRQAAQNQEDDNPLLASFLQNQISLDLQEYDNIFPYNTETILTDKHGALIAASHITTDYYQADEDWWRNAYQEGRGSIYFSQPAYDTSVGKNVMVIAVPVFDNDGQEVLGVIRSTYDLQGIIDVISGDLPGQQTYADLYFSNDAPRAIIDGQFSLPNPEAMQVLADLPSTSFTQAEYGGYSSIIARSPVTTLRNDPEIVRLGWFLVLRQRSEEALAPVAAQAESQIGLIGVVSGVVSFLSVILAQAISRPIKRLTETAEQVRAGNLSARADVASRDEVGRLGLAFNDMTEQLRRNVTDLEQRVAARTRELTLAGDVGRSLVEQRDLDELLKTAVEMIQSSFDLYYVQIYLMDERSKSLVLRAGSGETGGELLRRGHRLPVGLDSLNGAAVVSKQSRVVEDTLSAPDFKANVLLPDTRSEAAVPLMMGDRVVGVLDLQSQTPQAFNREILPAFQTLAAQLAVAVENAALFTQVQQARADVERQARRRTAASYDTFLDAINRPETQGYIFQDNAVQPLDASRPLDVAAPGQILNVPIIVTGEAVGELEVIRKGAPWQPDEVEWVKNITAQVARQIDNLRLLEQAERYRQEAEDAARRLIREGWQSYMREQPETPAFVYDQTQVTAQEVATALPFVQPLSVRGETIGEIGLEGGDDLDSDQRALLAAVAERLSEHIETLRLAEQTRSALAVTDALYASSEDVVRANTPNGVLDAVMKATALRQFERGAIMLFSAPWAEQPPDFVTVIAGKQDAENPSLPPLGISLPIRAMPILNLFNRDAPHIIEDIMVFEGLDPAMRGQLANLGRSLVAFPLVVADQWIGLMTFGSSEPRKLNEAQIRQAESLIGQGAAVIQGLSLLEESRRRARHEQVLRQVAERVRSAADPEQVLRLAAREVGMALGRNVVVRMRSEDSEEDLQPRPDDNGSSHPAADVVSEGA